MAVQAVNNIIALDVGERRIGVAIANNIARLPRPLTTLENNQDVVGELQRLITQEEVGVVVIGLPRNLKGEDTPQTAFVRQFALLLTHLAVVIKWQDEALTSVKAERELKERGRQYNKEDIDALAATYILDDYLQTEQES
jgi:putative Holliday junction resolvase